MQNTALSGLVSKPVFRTVMFFVVILCIATVLILLGRRSDAVTEAMRYQAGVLTADEVSVAFENVGGRLIARHVNESDHVKKGDVLLELDPADITIAISGLRAQLENLDAQIKSQMVALDNARDRVRTGEINTWRQIENLRAQQDGTEAALVQAEAEYRRYSSLNAASAVSKSAYDRAKAEYLQANAAAVSVRKNLEELTLGASREQLEKLNSKRDATGMTLSSIAQQQLDADNLENALDALIATRKNVQSQLDQQELNLSRTKLYAPCDGKVLEVMFEEGELIAPSAAAVSLETERKYYDVYVSERTAVKYHAGDDVTGYSPALDREVRGKVRFIEAAPTFADLRMTREQGQADLTSFKMRVYTEPVENLITGMTVELDDERN